MKKRYIASAILGAVTIVCLGSYISANNYGAKTESQLQTEYDDMQNVLSQYSQQVGEAVQVPEMYRDDFKDIISTEMSGRYGGGGSSAAFQWLKERELNYDSSVYTKVQQIIEAGRNKFENAQRIMLDTRRQYVASQKYFWRGMWLSVAGYPTVDVLKEYQIISTEKTQKVFEDKVETGPIKLR